MIVMFIQMVAPVLALPVSWLPPLGQAIIVCTIALALCGSMLRVMRGNRHRPVATGQESPVGRDAERCNGLVVERFADLAAGIFKLIEAGKAL